MYRTPKTRFGFRSIEAEGWIVHARSLMEKYALLHEGGSVTATFKYGSGFDGYTYRLCSFSCSRTLRWRTKKI